MTRQPIAPLDVTGLFPDMRADLLAVLADLAETQWFAPTACPGWTVKDVALHLLADDIGYLSRHRDKDGLSIEYETWDELVTQINAFNALWAQAARRISRRLLRDLLAFTGQQVNDYLADQLQQGGTASVAWAGDQPAPIWLQVARELTEYWMHHQHICEAVGQQRLQEARFMYPVLTAFAHALPRTFAAVDAPPDTLIVLDMQGQGGRSVHLVREEGGWQLYADTDLPPTTTIQIDVDTAWRLFTRGIDSQAAQQRATIRGEAALGEVFFQTVAIIA